ncbi:MAG TPA: type I pantothenate kinase [Acidimicrobiales bacterium]|nr:type I pantothenate kinase [Acidimicrobiales bacterium]
MTFDRARWAAVGTSLPVSGDATAVATAVGIPVDEVTEVYRPLAALLAVLAASRADERRRIADLVGLDHPPGPLMVGLTGGVAVGKSTTARVLRGLLPGTVEVVTTDSFLYPNAVLEERGLAGRKGFPETFDRDKLLDVLAAIRWGAPEVAVPVYTHGTYDIVPGAAHVLRQPSVVIVEGLNVLQWPGMQPAAVEVRPGPDGLEVADLLDWSVYVDADEADMARWFTDRVLRLRAQAAPGTYFHQFVAVPEDEVVAIAARVWADVNLVNLRQNVAPTRPRADVVLTKGADQRVHRVLLRGS